MASHTNTPQKPRGRGMSASGAFLPSRPPPAGAPPILDPLSVHVPHAKARPQPIPLARPTAGGAVASSAHHAGTFPPRPTGPSGLGTSRTGSMRAYGGAAPLLSRREPPPLAPLPRSPLSPDEEELMVRAEAAYHREQQENRQAAEAAARKRRAEIAARAPPVVLPPPAPMPRPRAQPPRPAAPPAGPPRASDAKKFTYGFNPVQPSNPVGGGVSGSYARGPSPSRATGGYGRDPSPYGPGIPRGPSPIFGRPPSRDGARPPSRTGRPLMRDPPRPVPVAARPSSASRRASLPSAPYASMSSSYQHSGAYRAPSPLRGQSPYGSLRDSGGYSNPYGSSYRAPTPERGRSHTRYGAPESVPERRRPEPIDPYQGPASDPLAWAQFEDHLRAAGEAGRKGNGGFTGY